jgi:UDP-3-O-[3-hydroxymyristoyl] glucosamine N-acyltransferase
LRKKSNAFSPPTWTDETGGKPNAASVKEGQLNFIFHEKETVMYTVDFIAQQIAGRVIGEGERKIERICPPDNITDGSIVFIKEKRRYEKLEKKNDAGCFIVDFEPSEREKSTFIVITPGLKEAAFIKLLSLFEETRPLSKKISEMAAIHPTVRIGSDVTIGDFVTVGENSSIDEGCSLGPNAVIGERCRIGRECIIYPNVTIYPDTVLEEGVIVHSGAVIGADGFSYSRINGVNHKVPQIGGVMIGRHVEIGANTTIDRATLGYTEIGENTKIDNLVQIGHNCRIGKNCIICALCGIAGSVTIGDNVILAGMVGLADHITVEDDVLIGAKAGVMKKLVKKGTYLFGYPAIDYKSEMEFNAVKPKLREVAHDVRRIKKSLNME